MTDDKEWTDWNKRELTILSRWFWGIVIAAVATFLYVLPRLVVAQEIPVYVVEHQAVKLQLLPSKCRDTTSMVMVASAPPQFQEGWKAISSQWRMQDGSWQEFAGCWLLVPKETVGTEDDVFVLLFSDGATVQVFKRDLLQKQPGV